MLRIELGVISQTPLVGIYWAAVFLINARLVGQ